MNAVNCLTPAQPSRLKPLQLGKTSLSQTHRLAVIIKPEAVRLGQSVNILRDIHEGLRKAGVEHRFGPALLIDPSAEFIDALYYEHSGKDLSELGIKTDQKFEAKDWFPRVFAPFMRGELIGSPLIAVMIEAKNGTAADLVTLLRNVVGETNPIALIRKDASSAKAEKSKIRHKFSTGSGARISPLPGSDGDVPLFTRVHCPATLEEARIQLKIIFRPEDLAAHYDDEAIAEILEEPVQVSRTAVSLAELAARDPKEAARQLKKTFKTLENTSEYDAELLVRGLNSLVPVMQESEKGLATSLGVPYDYVPYPHQVPTGKPAHLYVVVGPRGSGKTTTAEILSTRGSINAILPMYIYLGTSPGPEETPLSSELASQLFGQNAFASAQLGPGGWYLLSRSTLKGFADYHGGRALVFGGPGHARDLQAWAATQGNVIVHTARLAISEADLLARLSGRQREGDADYIRDVQAVCRGLEADAHLYEYTIDGAGTSEEIAARCEAWFKAAEAGEIVPKPMPDQGNPSPQKLFIRRLFTKIIVEKLMTDIMPKAGEIFIKTTRSGKQRPFDADDIEAYFSRTILPWLTTLYEELYRSTHGTIPEDDASLRSLQGTVMHAHWFLVSAVQAMRFFMDPKFFDDPKSVSKVTMRFLGRIAFTGMNPERTRKNYIRMAEVFRKLSIPEAFLWAVYHDLGKIERFHSHDTLTAKWLDDFDVLKDFESYFGEFSKEKIAITRAVLKHHHVIGSVVVPGFSFGFIKTLLKDPETLRLIWGGTSFNQKNAEILLRKLLQITIIDVSGGSIDGNLNNTNLEAYFTAHDLILEEMKKAPNPEALMARLDEISLSQTEERIALAIGYMDDKIDQRGPGYHVKILRDAVEEAVAQRIISREDWQTVLNNGHRIRETHYFLSDRLSQMEENGQCRIFAEGAEKGWVNPAFIMYNVIKAKVAERIHAETGKNDMAVYFVDKNGRPIFQHESEAKFNSALSAASPNPVFEGQTAYLVDSEGKRIDSVRINIVTKDNIYGDPDLAHIQIQLLDV